MVDVVILGRTDRYCSDDIEFPILGLSLYRERRSTPMGTRNSLRVMSLWREEMAKINLKNVGGNYHCCFLPVHIDVYILRNDVFRHMLHKNNSTVRYAD